MDKLAQEFADLAAKYGPHVAKAARAAATIESVGYIIAAVIFAVGAVLAFFAARFCWRKGHEDYADEDWFLGFGIVAVIGVICAIVFVGILADPWTWVPLWNPDVYLAKQAFGL